MSGTAAKIECSEKQQRILQRAARSSTASRRLVQRSNVILLAWAGWLNVAIADEVGLSCNQVGLWRRRWQASFDALVAIECQESTAALRRAVEDVLSDASRSGSSGKFTGEEVTLILALACEPPEASGRPIERWTHRELADEVNERGIASISVSQVGRLLRQADLQPHRSKYWLNSKEKDPEVFREQVEGVCHAYLEAPDLYTKHGIHTASIDEMPSLQALERIAEKIPMRSGQVERIEYEYKRHGTLCLIGSWDVALGQLIAPTIRPTRTEKDFAWHIHHTVATDPDAGWVFVVDNLNTHCSETLVRWVARLEGIDESTLGAKGKAGVLQSMETRKAFLADRGHRIRFVYLPKHSSWLNQIEIVFGIVARRVMRRASFPSIDALKDRLLRFIDYFNRTFAKPFNWTYTGRPVANNVEKRPGTWKESWAKRRQAAQTYALVT